jgi:hypothetical protein
MNSYGENSQDNSVPSVLLGDVSETMLNSLKRRSDNSDTGRWLSGLVDHALDVGAKGESEQPVTIMDLDTMIRWVGKLFNEFELYKIEFNQKAVGTDLIVASSPVNLENLSASNDSFEAHLSTRYWSMAFDASTRKLDVYLIPAELLLAFTTNRINDMDYKPFISFTPRRLNEEYYWTVDQQLITFDMLPKLAKELFGDLINVASGTIKEDEVYRSSSTEAPSPETDPNASASADRSYEMETPSASVFESENGGTDLLKFEDPTHPATPAFKESATDLSHNILAICEHYLGSIDREMQSVIEFARARPDDVDELITCKQILIELGSLREATAQTVEKMRALSRPV